MTQEISSASVSPMLSWPETWWQALTRPTVTTYAGFANAPYARRNIAYSWIVRSALVVGLVLGLFSPNANAGGICLGPLIAVLISLLIFVFMTGLSQWLARRLGGTGTYDAFAYASAACFVPALLISSLLSLFPALTLLQGVLEFYFLFLSIVAVKAAHQLGWGRAVIVSAFPVAVVIAFMVCVLIALRVLETQAAGLHLGAAS